MSKPAATSTPSKRRGRAPGPTGPTVHGGSRDARRLTAVILEVLAGGRTPAEAATALGVSVPRYYALESRALQGLVAACEPRARGRQRSPERELAALRVEVERLQRQSARAQALLRLSQRAVGVAAPADKPARAAAGKRRVRKPVARALKAASKLRTTDENLPTEIGDATTR